MTKRSTKELGDEGETLAITYLEEQGMRIVERNYRKRQGEIDIIGYHDDYLVFVEVKYRRSTNKGTPEEAVGYAKQRTICRVADGYRQQHRLPDTTSVRYDVLAIYEDKVNWYQNAFSHIYR